MNAIGTIREFKTRNFRVIVDAIEDFAPDLSWDGDGSVREGLESGRFIVFTARARVFLNGSELSSDYLGECIYESLEAFADHKEVGRENARLAASGEAGRCGSYFHDMVRSVCSDARKTLKAQSAIHVR